MKPLASERKYLLEVIDPASGRKTPPMTMQLGELIKSHNEAIAECVKDGSADANLDPYVNIFFDVTDGIDKTEDFMRIPIFRMSTLESLINQEQTQ